MNPPFYAEVTDAPMPTHVAWLTAADGTRLRVARWGRGDAPLVAIFPGRTEVIEKYGPTVTYLLARGHDAAVIDWRGQGLSDRSCAHALRGDVPDFANYQNDVQAFWAWLDGLGASQPRYILAHSMGGCIALRSLANGLSVRAVAFSAPMWGLTLPRATQHAVAPLASVLRVFGRDTDEVPGAGEEFELWNFPFERNLLTRDATAYAAVKAQLRARPELRLGAPSIRWLAAALREMKALAHLPSPQVPAFCGIGTGDVIVSQSAIHQRMAAWPQGHLVEYEGALHELLIERPEVRGDFLDQALALFAQTP